MDLPVQWYGVTREVSVSWSQIGTLLRSVSVSLFGRTSHWLVVRSGDSSSTF